MPVTCGLEPNVKYANETNPMSKQKKLKVKYAIGTIALPKVLTMRPKLSSNCVIITTARKKIINRLIAVKYTCHETMLVRSINFKKSSK
jgi:hypothetical protein